MLCLASVGVACGIERRAACCAWSSTQAANCSGRHRVHVEMHVGEAVAAEVARQAVERAGRVGLQVQLRRHAVHRVDHAAELRDEERVHHAGRGQREMHRHAGRDHQLVDARDVLVGVDEQPFPIERDDLDLERRRLRCQRLGGIEVVRADPGHAAQQHDRQQRDRPDDQLDAGRNRPSPADSVPACSRRGTTRRRRSVAAIVGTTIASMIASESIRIVFSASPTGPCGSSTAGWHAVSTIGAHEDCAAPGPGVHRTKAPQRSRSVWQSLSLAV